MPGLKTLEGLVLGLGLCALACAPDDSGSRLGYNTDTTETGSAGDGIPNPFGEDEFGDEFGNGDGDGDGDGDPDGGDGDGDGDGNGDGDGDGDGDGNGDGDGDGDDDGLEAICAGPCGTPGCGTCPDAPTVDADWFLIDATEVTVADYADFVAQTFHPIVLSGECLWKQDAGWFEPDNWDVQLDDDPQNPVHGVDWCDAEAYCGWAGKRLCGLVGGGPAQLDELVDGPNEWFRACTGAGVSTYPYGNTYKQFACNGVGQGLGGVMPVATLANCQGSFEGLFDMSGNLWEWTNACSDNPDTQPWQQDCRRRGGSFYSSKEILRCAVDSRRHRGYRDDSTGIRCCQ